MRATYEGVLARADSYWLQLHKSKREVATLTARLIVMSAALEDVVGACDYCEPIARAALDLDKEAAR